MTKMTLPDKTEKEVSKSVVFRVKSVKKREKWPIFSRVLTKVNKSEK